jgi:succinyl-CoA synthetase beta subunit
MGGAKAPITTFIVEPFVPHDDEYYFSIVSERLGSKVSFSECGGIDIEENWDKVNQSHCKCQLLETCVVVEAYTQSYASFL